MCKRKRFHVVRYGSGRYMPSEHVSDRATSVTHCYQRYHRLLGYMIGNYNLLKVWPESLGWKQVSVGTQMS